MTTHLSPDDLAAAAEGTLDAACAAHLAECARCRASLSGLSKVLSTTKSVSVPEPSPLFWDHFSTRVREATATQPLPARGLWLFSRPVLALGALAAVAWVLFVWPSSAIRTSNVPGMSVTTDGSASDPDAAWTAMAEMAASMTTDDVRTATASAPERVSVLGELSVDERAAFVELLKLEIGDAE